MEWYYSDNGQQAGPYSEADFNDLVQQGKIQDETLVWHEGMTDWLPYSQVSASIAPSTSASGTSAASTAAPTSPDGTVVCNECGNTFPQNEVVRYGNQNVCATCKPIFVQKLKEGVVPAGDFEYAGFWIRAGAKILDYIILFIPSFILQLLAGIDTYGIIGTPQSPDIAIYVIVQVFLFCLNIAYYVWFVGRYAQTPGKMACGIKIIMSDGSRVSFMRAFGRFWADVVSQLTCWIGYIIAAFDEEKRALHDHICNTRVIYKR